MTASSPGGQTDERLFMVAAASGMSEGVPSDGGFLLEKTFSTNLLRQINQQSVLLPKCRKIPLGANSDGAKLPVNDETSRATGSRFGGVRIYWTDEGGEITSSKPKFRRLQLELRKATGLCYATDEIIKDSNVLEAVVKDSFISEMAFTVDDCIVRGDGATKPLGILNSGALLSVSAVSGQGAATVLYENIIAMWSRMPARNRKTAVWLINQDIEPQLSSMSLPVGTGGVPVYMPAGGLSDEPYGRLYGRPVLPIEQCETLGTVGDILLVDLNEYVWIDRGSVQTDASMHVRFVYDEKTFRFIYRCDGQPIWNSTLTPYKGSNTLSPYVALATRS